MNLTSFLNSRVRRGALLSVLSLSALALSGCGGGSGGPSGGGNGGGGGGGGTTLGENTIVFVSNRDGNQEIYRSTNTGVSQTRITSSAAADTDPFLARNRQFIVFTSLRDGNAEIYRFNVSDSTLQRLTADATDVTDVSPVVSPNSARIAWVSDRGGANNVWIMDATGANQTQVTTTGGTSPTFAPDSNQIAYVNNGVDIVVRNLTTGVTRTIETNLAAPSTIDDLSWSPDGSQIAYTERVNLNPVSNIKVISASANNTSAATTFQGVAGSKQSLTWGPTSAQQNLVFSAAANGTTNLFSAITVNATAATQITTQGTNTDVSWIN